MPWKIEREFRILLGGNIYINVPNLVVFRGEPLFTVKRRESDLVLGIDFDIFDEKGQRVATVRNGNVVQGNENDYRIVREAAHYQVIEKATNRIICDIRKREKAKWAELEISVDMFTRSGFRFKATPNGTNLGNIHISGCVFKDCGTGISMD